MLISELEALMEDYFKLPIDHRAWGFDTAKDEAEYHVYGFLQHLKETYGSTHTDSRVITADIPNCCGGNCGCKELPEG